MTHFTDFKSFDTNKKSVLEDGEDEKQSRFPQYSSSVESWQAMNVNQREHK